MKKAAIRGKFPSTPEVAKSLRAFGFFRDSSVGRSIPYIVGFGTFGTSKRKARMGRNPQTGKPIKIAAKKVARFTTGTRVVRARQGPVIMTGFPDTRRRTGRKSTKKSAPLSAKRSVTRKAVVRKSASRRSTKKSNRR